MGAVVAEKRIPDMPKYVGKGLCSLTHREWNKCPKDLLHFEINILYIFFYVPQQDKYA